MIDLVLRAPSPASLFLRNLIGVKSDDLGDSLAGLIEGNVYVRASQGLERFGGIPEVFQRGGSVVNLLEELQSLGRVGVLFVFEVGGEACLGAAHDI